ncbi:unnamed protein product [Paramecium primaurelia]|uniref:Uncharacterized protein n=1 Tax=Paramecium primaurelia TaxID=5886 RepID=A0A8S1JPU3_PARPR|nr:unnamed protein product [Paramecium primaurelia]
MRTLLILYQLLFLIILQLSQNIKLQLLKMKNSLNQKLQL